MAAWIRRLASSESGAVQMNLRRLLLIFLSERGFFFFFFFTFKKRAGVDGQYGRDEMRGGGTRLRQSKDGV